MRPSLTLLTCLGVAGSLVCAYEVVPKIGAHNREVLITAAGYDVRHGIKAAVDAYKANTGDYPRDLGALLRNTAGVSNWSGPYLDLAWKPVDPWGNPYIYRYPGRHNPQSYDLLSAGPDGKEGTADDIGNW